MKDCIGICRNVHVKQPSYGTAMVYFRGQDMMSSECRGLWPTVDAQNFFRHSGEIFKKKKKHPVIKAQLLSCPGLRRRGSPQQHMPACQPWKFFGGEI